MATTPRTSAQRVVDYPTSDGKPMAETELHLERMMDLISTLQDHFAAEPMVHVGGNLLLFYEEGNRRRHVSPDAFVVRGISKLPLRDYYLLWKEGKSPDVVIEITSKTTRREDQNKKSQLHRDVLKVPEYFQFDPREEYLKPPLQGHRLVAGQYEPIAPVGGRLPSAVLGLHLERQGTVLRLYDPATGKYLETPRERAASAEAARQHEAEARQRADEARQRADEVRLHVEAENARLQRELEALRARPGGRPTDDA
jgi:Uma2 family endonuclease